MKDKQPNSISILSYKKRLFVFILFFSLTSIASAQKKYSRNYYNNGSLKEEGWLSNTKKVDFWKFYYKNGVLKKQGHFKDNFPVKYWYFYRKNSSKEKEGHFIKGKQNKWWLYYDKKGTINHKCQLKNDKKHGYCLVYKKKELIKAVRFKDGKKVNEWTDFSSFKEENNLTDLK